MRRTVLATALVVCTLAGAPIARAHPHAWIDLRSTVLLDASGRIVGIEQKWLFDEFYSLFATEEASKSPGSRAAALHALAGDNLANLRAYNYFTEARVHGRQVGFDTVSEFEAELRGGRLWLRFVVPFATPVEPDSDAFTFAIFDPTYYIEMRHVDGEVIGFRGPQNERCASQIIAPKPTAQAVLMAKALDRDVTPDATLGRIFAERVEVTCR